MPARLSVKLPLVFCAFTAATVLAGLWGLHQLNTTIEVYDQTLHDEVALERQVGQAQLDFKVQVQEWKNVLVRGRDEAARNRHWQSFQQHELRVAAAIDSLRGKLPEGPQRVLATEFGTAHAAMGRSYRQGLQAFVAAQADPAAGDQAVRGIDRAPTDLLSKLTKTTARDAEQAVSDARAARRRALITSLVLMALSLAAGAVAGVLVSRRITRPLADAVHLARAVAGGDLTQQVQVRGDAEVHELLQALQDMTRRLTDLVQTVRASSDSIATGSRQIATGSADLSQRTESAASSLQQTAAAMEQLAGSAHATLGTARQAGQVADHARAAADGGGQVVLQVALTMQGVSDSSRRIADIVATIDGIAFQTNILALNAAVEAARAGEQGRGFAVVASEVRALAQRSSVAAREIRTLIGGSVGTVEQASGLAQRAGQQISALVQQVAQVSTLVTGLAHGASEQTGGLDQINQAVSQLDRMTQQNSALVEESTAAAQSLSEQARALMQAVHSFQLPHGRGVVAG